MPSESDDDRSEESDKADSEQMCPDPAAKKSDTSSDSDDDSVTESDDEHVSQASTHAGEASASTSQYRQSSTHDGRPAKRSKVTQPFCIWTSLASLLKAVKTTTSQLQVHPRSVKHFCAVIINRKSYI